MRCLLLAVSFATVGCVQSLQPIIPAGRTDKDDAIVGRWSDGATSILIEPHSLDASQYAMTLRANGKTVEYDIRVEKLGDNRYCQLAFAESDDRMRLSAYQFGRYRVVNDALLIAIPDRQRWVSAIRLAGLQFVDRDGFVILTSPTAKIRRILTADTGQLFDQSQKFARVKDLPE